MKKDIIQQSYERHSEHEAYLEEASCYTDPGSIDAWSHDRMIKSISPLFKFFPGAEFVTVGDGRFGADAYQLKKHGMHVMATSLTDNYLKIAKVRGYIDKFLAVNAEKMPFFDSSFDFAFCKQSYHHFPRPAIAFYEMLRVASKAVILIEPTDDGVGLINFLKPFLKKLIRKEKFYDYETSGNYIFRINSKEMKRMLTAIDRPLFAIKYYNDFYLAKISFQRSNWKSPGFLLTHFAIFVQNVLCFLKLMKYARATIIAFKTDISSDLKKELRKNGFKLTFLPKNPYLTEG
ncbi:MAG: methyltransferase domain-containing protein [Paludibacter sp.]|nr:methyltransferase domain-containing protein [Paludibacter sp.]